MAEFKRRKIKNKTLGDILKTAREKKKITLEQAEEETKVREKYLLSLENNDFDLLPGNVYALGFLAKYADFLGLNKKELINQFKAERGESSRAGKFRPNNKNYESSFTITPKIITIFLFIIGVAIIIGYIMYNVRAFLSPPNLIISSPRSEQIIKEDRINITGKTDEGVSLTINDQSILIDNVGNFTQDVKLNPGLNTFKIQAINRMKKITIKEIKILAQY